MASRVYRFLLGNYYTLYHFQKLIVKYRVHYDRRRFRRIYEHFSQYALFQYRALYPGKQHSKRYRGYPLSISSQPGYLRFQKYFYFFYALRCFAIVLLKWTTDTEAKRIWIGTEMIKKESPFIEATFALCSTIGYLYCQFSLSNSLLDYKFLAIIKVSPKRPEYLRAADLGLTEDQLLRLYRFRQVALFFLHQAMASIPIFGPASVVLLYLQTSLYRTHLLISLFWTILRSYFIYAISALLYTNLIYFIIVAKYLHLKQQAIVASLLRSLTQLLTNRRNMVLKAKRLHLIKPLPDSKPYMDRLVRQNICYTYLQDELADYNRFWRLYLSFIFVIYVLFIGLILFIIILTDLLLFGKITYGIVFCVNWAILVAIILYGGQIYTQNEALSQRFASLLGESVQLSLQLPVLQTIKMNNMSAYLKDAPSGFSLLNGYVINYDTLRLVGCVYSKLGFPTKPQLVAQCRRFFLFQLIVNIAIYFLLIIKKIMKSNVSV